MFDNDFEVFICDTYESKRINYNIRYQVYCEETQFEDPARFPDHMEWDDYDSNSIHFAVRSKRTQEWVAASRLVLGRPKDLPFWSHCQVSYNEYANLTNAAELSRLCILGSYRKAVLKTDPSEHSADSSSNVVKVRARRKEPEILLGLLRAMSHASRAYGIKNWLAMQSPSLTRAVQLMGFSLNTIGPAVEHRGMRVPVFSTVKEFSAGLNKSSVIGQMFNAPGYFCYSNAAPKLERMRV